MTNICTKVTVRKRPIKNGQLSLYLDFYPPVKNPKTGKTTRREYLGIYIYANPTEKFEAEFNKTMLRNAELIKCKRTEAIINEEFGFLDRNRGKESFLDYFRSKMADDDNFRNWNTAYKHFEKYCGGSCTFDDLSLDYCQGFLTYLLSLTTQTKGKMMASSANNNLNKLKCVLRLAYEEKRIRENIAPRLKHAKEANTRREFLTLEEVKMLANTPCEKPVIRTAALFSCLTGLRISDIWKIQCKLPPKTKRFCPLKTFNNAPLKSLDRWGYYYFSLFPSVCSHFTDTFSCQLNPVRRMYNTIHNGICYCRVSDCIIPIVRWQLRGDDDGLAPMSVLYYIEQDGSFLGIKVHKEEVIQYEQRAPFDSLEFRFQCAFYFCHLKRTHKFRSIRIICPYALLAGFIPHCCGKEALPGTG